MPEEERTLRLNLGCGTKQFEGFVNVDKVQLPGVDAIADLEEKRWPWDDNSIEEIRAYHIIEHIREPYDFVQECRRILKPGGILDLRFPHRKHHTAYVITHRNRFDEYSFVSVTATHQFDIAELNVLHDWPYYWHIQNHLGEWLLKMPFFRKREVQIKLRKAVRKEQGDIQE